jgi:hypothetical protein
MPLRVATQILDARDDTVLLEMGVEGATAHFSPGDTIVLGNEETEAAWVVRSTANIFFEGEMVVRLIMCRPIGGEWDGSADRYIEQNA